MRSWSRSAGWTSYAVAAATTLTLACGGGGDSGPQLGGIAFGNGTFVAVGESAEAYANPGPGWTPSGTGVGSLEAVTWASVEQLFVGVGDGGAIVTSPDGTSWTQQLSPTPANLHGVAAGGGRIVAVGDSGTILTSSTGGISWTQQASGTGATLFGVGFGNGVFLAVGAGGTFVTSTDLGATWVPGNTGLSNDLYATAFGAGNWVAVGADGALLVSADGGAIWQVVGVSVLPNLNDVIFTQGIFVVVGDEGVILTSPDGSDYGASVTDSGQFIFGVAFGNGGFIAVASGGHVFTSLDAAIWQEGKV